MKQHRRVISHLVFALLLLVVSLLLPPIITGILGLFFIVFSCLTWEVYGGLFSSFWASATMLFVFLTKGFAFLDLVAAAFGYFILGIALGNTMKYIHRQKQRLDSILEGTDAGTWEWNRKTGEILINETWAENLGYRLEELAPFSINTWHGLAHPLDVERRAHLLERHFKGELDHYTIEYRLRHKEGHWVWVLEQGKVLQWQNDGSPLWMFGTQLDITSHKKAEEDLQKKDRKLSLAQEFAQAGTWEYRISNGSLNWSKECEHLFGLEEGEFEGTFDAFLKRVHPFDQDYVQDINRPIIDRRESIALNYVHRIVKKDGEICWVRELSGVDKDEEGQVISIIGLVIDITQQKEAEIALQESEENLRITLNSIGDAVIVTDISGFVVRMNLEAERLTGYSISEVEHRPLSHFFSIVHIETRESFLDPVFEVLKLGETVSMSKIILLISKDRRERQIALLASPIFNEIGEGKGVVIVFRDSTEEERMQRKVEERELRFQKMLSLIPDMVSIHDKEMNILYSNWNGFGSVPEEKRILHTKCYATYRGRTSVCPDCHAKSVFKTKKPFQMEFHLPDDTWIDLRVLPILDENSELEMFVEWVRDITDRKKAERDLLEKEEQFRLLSEFASDMVWIADMDLMYTYVSPSVERVLGYTVEECLHESVNKTLAPSSLEVAKSLYQEELAKEGEEERSRPIELEHVSREGSSVWVEVKMKVLRDTMGSPAAILGVARDITDRKRAEESLKESEQRLNMLISNTPAVIYSYRIKDAQAQFTYINENVKHILGFEPEELLHNASLYKECLHPHDMQKIEARLALLLEKGRDTIEYRFKDVRGQYHWLCDEQKVIAHDDGSYDVIGTWWDITDRKEAEERLLEETRKAERLYQKLEEEMDKARQVHQQILPKSLPAVEGLSFATHYQPAEKIGGDFYEVIRVRNKLILYLSDVSGHGLDSAMLSLFVKHTIHSFLAFSPSDAIAPATILRYLFGQFQKENYPESYFICIFLGVLDLETMEMRYKSMGFQDLPLVQLGDGERLTMMSKGLFITSYFPMEVMNFEEGQLILTPGTTIFFNTDGLTEEGGPKAYYRERLNHVFYENAHFRPHRIARRVIEDFKAFNNGNLQGKDDITFIVMQVEPIQRGDHFYWELATDLKELHRLREEMRSSFRDREEFHDLLTCSLEMVANAMEHGNLLDPLKRVWVDIYVMGESIVVAIEDEGEGFDWREKMEKPFDLSGYTERGRGIAMTQLFCDTLKYNEQGNRVSFTVKKEKDLKL